MHGGLAQVGVDQHDLLLERRRGVGEVHGGERLARGLVRADDRDGARLARAFEDHEIGAQDAVGLHHLDALAARDLGEDRQAGERRDLGAVLVAREAVAGEVGEHGELADDDERDQEPEDRVAEAASARSGPGRRARRRRSWSRRPASRTPAASSWRIWLICASSVIASALPCTAWVALLLEVLAPDPQRVDDVVDLLVADGADRLDELAAGDPGEGLGVLAVRAGGLHVEVAEVTDRRRGDARRRLAAARASACCHAPPR